MASSVFSWFKDRGSTSPTTRQPAHRPGPHDITESLNCNAELTQGLYRNTYPGLKLAGSLAYAPIAHPVAFMGLPTPKAKTARTQAALDGIVEAMSKRMTALHIMVPRDGTAWIWPKFDRKAGRLVWEFIPDDTITDIVKSPDTQEVEAIYTDEEFKVSTGGDGIFTYARRKRVFTREKIEVRWSQVGSLAGTLMDKTSRNVLGILPIPFANMPEADEARGHSDYERILYDLKDYHDIDYARSEILTKFKPKMVQEVENIDKWLANNGYDGIDEVDPWGVDLIINLKDHETTTFEVAKNATDAYEKALENKYWKIVEGSGIPEIFWGLQASGNEASVDDQRQAMVRYVEVKRTQITNAYTRLFRASLELLGISGNGARGAFEMQWNRLDGISEKVKSEIFKNFASGLAVTAGKDVMTRQQVWSLWRENYPAATRETFEEFEAAFGGGEPEAPDGADGDAPPVVVNDK